MARFQEEEILKKPMKTVEIYGCEVDKQIQQRVKEMIMSYKPEKSKEAPIELQIHLKDDVPVSQRPRRLALKEQEEVEAQIKQWLDDGIIRLKLREKPSKD